MAFSTRLARRCAPARRARSIPVARRLAGVARGLVAGAAVSAGALACGPSAPRCSEADPCAPPAVCVDGVCVGGDSATVDGMAWIDARPAVDGNPLWPDASPVCGSKTSRVTETQEFFTVPADVTFVHIKAWGAGGNQEDNACADLLTGGVGGYSEAVFSVSAGDPMVIIVGKLGRAGDATPQERFRFGFGNWGGGGLSGVFSGATAITAGDFDRALVIAGGGGSAGAPSCTRGGSGNHTNPAIAGGASNMQGTVGEDDINGGAGGYRGGLGGGRDEPSRGGTGYVSPAAVDKRMLFVEPGSEFPPKSDDPDYDGSAGTLERSGLVIMHFTCEPPPIL